MLNRKKSSLYCNDHTPTPHLPEGRPWPSIIFIDIIVRAKQSGTDFMGTFCFDASYKPFALIDTVRKEDEEEKERE